MVDFWDRVYESTKNIFVYVKKGVIPAFGAILLYLIASGLVTNVTTSGDSVCGETCYAYVNVTGKAGYTIWLPTGVLFETEPQIPIESYRKVKGLWEPLDRFYISSGNNEYMFVGHKKPSENVKWTFTSYLNTEDPFWNGTAGADSRFALVENTNSFADDFESYSMVNQKNLMFYAPMDGTMEDYSNSKFSVIVENATLNTSGKFCSGYRFVQTNGNMDYIMIPNNTITSGWFDSTESKPFTMAMWVYFDETGTRNENLFGFLPNGSSTINKGFRISGGKLRFYSTQVNTSQYNCYSAEAAATGTGWKHLAITYDGTDCQWYVNGATSGTATPIHVYNFTSPIVIFGTSYRDDTKATSDQFNGTMDEVMFWNRALRSNEVSVIYNKYLTNTSSNWANDTSATNTCFRVMNRTDENNNPTYVLEETFGDSSNLTDANDQPIFISAKTYENYTITWKQNFGSNPTWGGMFLRWIDSRNWVYLTFNNDLFELEYLVDGSGAPIQQNAASISPNTWYYFRVTVNGGVWTISNGTDGHTWTTYDSVTDNSFKSGYIALYGGLRGQKWDNILVQEIIQPATNTSVNTGKVSTNSNITGSWMFYDALGDSKGESRVTFRKTYANYPQNNHLVSQWEMDKGCNSTHVDDVKGLNDGIISGAIMTSDGKYGNAYWFDGTNDFINVSYASSLNLSQFSVFGWFKTPDVGVNRAIAARDDGTKRVWSLLVGTTGKVSVVIRNSTGNAVQVDSSSLNLDDNSWHHGGFTFNGTTITVYVDGINVGNGAVVGGIRTDLNTDLWIGRYYSSGNYFNGTIDEVMVWNTTLSPNEVEFLYNTQYHYETPVSVGYWNFDGENANDVGLVQNGLDGTVSGATWTTAGIKGGAYEFDGDNDYISIADDSKYYARDKFTTSLWVKLHENNTQRQCLIAKHDYGMLIYFMEDTDNFRLSTTTSGGVNSYSTTTPKIETWYHVVGVYNGTHQMIYVNGIREDIDAQTGFILNGNQPLEIGSRNTGTNDANATIDEVMVFTKALTDTEVWNLYNGHYTLDSSATSSSCIEAWDADLEQIDDSTTGDRSTAESQIVRISNTDSSTPQFPISGWIPPTGGTGKYDTGFTPYAVCTDTCLEYANVLVYNLTDAALVNVSEYVYGQSNFTWYKYVNTTTWDYGQYYYKFLCSDSG